MGAEAEADAEAEAEAEAEAKAVAEAEAEATLKQRQTQRATRWLRWLKIYMALTTTLLCKNMSSVMLMLMLSQLGLCKTTVYTEASEDDDFSKKINKRKHSDEHCKAAKTKKSNANDHEINTIDMILFKFGSIDQNKTLSNK